VAAINATPAKKNLLLFMWDLLEKLRRYGNKEALLVCKNCVNPVPAGSARTSPRDNGVRPKTLCLLTLSCGQLNPHGLTQRLHLLCAFGVEQIWHLHLPEDILLLILRQTSVLSPKFIDEQPQILRLTTPELKYVRNPFAQNDTDFVLPISDSGH
jgi:hypothetical protein